jgi:hypothetical protein
MIKVATWGLISSFLLFPTALPAQGDQPDP